MLRPHKQLRRCQNVHFPGRLLQIERLENRLALSTCASCTSVDIVPENLVSPESLVSYLPPSSAIETSIVPVQVVSPLPDTTTDPLIAADPVAVNVVFNNWDAVNLTYGDPLPASPTPSPEVEVYRFSDPLTLPSNTRPEIVDFWGQQGPANVWTFRGRVVDNLDPAGLEVRFSGILAGTGPVTVLENGTFYVSVILRPGTQGWAVATVTDADGQTSQEAADYISFT